MLKISGYNTSSRTKFYLHCPKCGTPGEIALPHFLVAVNTEERLYCLDCNNSFRIVFEMLDPRSPTLREPVQSGQICPQCAGSGRVKFNSGRRYPCGKCNGSGQI